MGVLQRLIISRQLFGLLPTFCVKCKEIKSFKIIDPDGSYTIRCHCGCRILKYHLPDQNHLTAFFIEKYVTKEEYDRNYKKKSIPEQYGFKKIEKNGKMVFVNE